MALSDLFSGLTVNLTGVVTGTATIDNNGVITIDTAMSTNQFEGQDISTNSAYVSDTTSEHYDVNKVQSGGVYYINAASGTWDNLPTAISNHKIMYIIFGATVGNMTRYLHIAWSLTTQALYLRMQTGTTASTFHPWRKVTLES